MRERKGGEKGGENKDSLPQKANKGPELKTETDEQLMVVYQKGNSQAFEILYERHSGKVYGFLKNRLSDRVLIEDIFQATFLKLHQSRTHYDPSFSFLPWLFSVARSSLVDSLRKKRRIEEDPDLVALAQAAAPMDKASASLPDIDLLPKDQREAILLRYSENLDFTEIARRLETSPSNARQLVSRAVRQLRKFVSISDGSGT